MTLIQEMKKIYAEFHVEGDEKYTIRSLRWRGTPVSLEKAHEAFNAACSGYNDFDSEICFTKLKTICKDYIVQVSPAREYSVALYLHAQTAEDATAIMTKLKRARSLHVDELDFENPTTIRMWWD